MRIAVIDLGSNTCRMVVFEASLGYTFRLVDQIREMVRLREGMGVDGMAAPAMDRAIATLRLYRRYCDSSAVDQIIATATSAVRDAKNGPQFLDRSRAEAGIELRVLTGPEEAYYGVVGALNNISVTDGWVLDIGGGSAQISRIEQGKFVSGEALPLGALRLTETFVTSDPPNESEQKAIENEVDRQLRNLPWLVPSRGERLVGLGGTIRNLAYMDIARSALPVESLHGFSLTQKSIRASLRQLTKLPQAKRERINGLNSDRADIIAAGAIVLDRIIRYLGCAEIAVSVNGIREGLFFEQFWSHLESPVVSDVRRFGVLNLARMYNYEKAHANHVRYLALRLFDQSSALHGYGTDVRELLEAAALLHDIGTVIGYKGHHRHSANLIRSNGIAGFSTRETVLIALATEYHRKGRPELNEGTVLFNKDDGRLLLVLSSILRLAEFLERGRNAIVSDVIVKWTTSDLEITLVADEFPSVEMWEAKRQAVPLLEEVFGRAVLIRSLVPSNDDGVVKAPDPPNPVDEEDDYFSGRSR
jgi:exopolyphosphatase/guanosine-5'-triphosphate,3'-diphosphate pyrophosphatase